MNVKLLWQNHKSTCIYSIFAIVSAIVFSILIVWSCLGNSFMDVAIIDATVIANNSAQDEYLVGQKFNGEGLSLDIGSEVVSIKDCEVQYDFSSAGNKQVKLIYSPNAQTSYVGVHDVKVYFVRSLTPLSIPSEIEVLDDGSFVADDGFSLKAQLNALPQDEDRFERVVGEENTILLTPESYTTKTVASVSIEGYYDASLYCGNLTYNFSFYNSAGKTFIVQSEKSVIEYTNENVGSKNKMTLVVTDVDENYAQTCTGESNGYYVYTKENGEQTVLDFSFELTQTQEKFKSSQVSSESHVADKYSVVYGQETFTCPADLWQGAVVNGKIYSEGERKLVASSDNRVLELTNSSGGVETLTLYVTNFTYDSGGSGKSNGYYVYTDANGQVFVAKFFMQIWTYDWVPLSKDKADMYSDLDVFDYIIDHYNGDMFVNVSTYTRTDGWTSQVSFVTDADSIKRAAFNA